MRAIIIQTCVAALFVQMAVSGELSLVGVHPTSPLTAFPSIHALKAHEGRIYMGYGDWNVYPAVAVVSYDPTLNGFRLEYLAHSDSVDQFRSVGGKLYAPSIDPIHFDGFQDFSVREAGVWRSFAPAGFFHVFDMDTLNGADLWFVGAKSATETPSSGAAVMRSLDDGRTWLDLTGTSTAARYYFGFALRGSFYVYDRAYSGSSFGTIPAAPYGLYFNRATVVGNGTNAFAIGLTGRPPGIADSQPRPLATFDGATWRLLNASVQHFTVQDSTLYAAMSNGFWRTASLSATQAIWEPLPLNGITNVTSIEVLGAIIYVANAQGQLWAGRLDGMPMEQNAASVINEIPDGFGEALSVSGSTMAVGAPSFSGVQYACGQVTVWEQTNSTWELRQTITAPQPSFSGWFGKDVAVAGNLLAVLEAGRDLSGQDRGDAAQVHLYQRTAQGWQLRQTLTRGYAHAIALDSQRLAIATTSTLYVYRLLGVDPVQVSLEASLPHNVNLGILYEPTGRVALDGARLAYGLAGDFSRSGGPGQVNVYERSPGGSWLLLTNLIQNTPPLPAGLGRHPDAFGFALSLKNGWLAVGAPRDDTAAAQAGAVHLYQRVGDGGTISYVRQNTIVSPFPQAQGRFGHAVSLTDSHLLVGAPGMDLQNGQHGHVFVYERQEPYWMPLAELLPPSGAQAQFGLEVFATDNLLFAGCEAAPQSTGLPERVAIVPVPNAPITADLSLNITVAPLVVTNGTAMSFHLTVSNAGPVTATNIQVVFALPANIEINAIISNSFSCTNTGTELHCMTEQLPAASAGSLTVHGRANLPNSCGVIRGHGFALAQVFDPTIGNNQASAAASSQPAEVSLTTPAEGTMIPYAGSVQITAQASSADGIANVSFYANDNLLKLFTNAPYTYVWSNVPPGLHRLTARATNRCSVGSISAPLTISAQSNMLPQVTLLAPASGTRFANTNNIAVYVSASDPDGTLNRVEVHRGHALWRTLFNPPYHVVWSNAPNGSHVLQAVARDNRGAATTSHLARIVIGPEQTGGTNWVAFNDHSAGVARSNVTRWDVLGSAPGPGGALRNSTSAALLPARLTMTRSVATFYSTTGAAPDPGSPAAQWFGGFVDFAGGSSPNVGIITPAWVRYLFSGLDPNLRYNFAGTAVRGNPAYTNRWTRIELEGARSFDPAHSAGCLIQGTGSITSNQVALNTGLNLTGDVASWSNIQPDRDGTLDVICTQYSGPVAGGDSEGASGYALTALRLEEISVPVTSPPMISAHPVSLTLSPQSRAAFSVAASAQGTLSYQWLRNLTAVAGGTAGSLVIDSASTNDVGTYSAIVTGETGSSVSQTAVLTLISINVQTDTPERLARLTLLGPVGQRYSVQHVDAIEPVLSWTELTNFALPSSPFVFMDEDSRNSSSRFYRVVPQL